jgi:hypothetical protein
VVAFSASARSRHRLLWSSVVPGIEATEVTSHSVCQSAGQAPGQRRGGDPNLPTQVPRQGAGTGRAWPGCAANGPAVLRNVRSQDTSPSPNSSVPGGQAFPARAGIRSWEMSTERCEKCDLLIGAGCACDLIKAPEEAGYGSACRWIRFGPDTLLISSRNMAHVPGACTHVGEEHVLDPGKGCGWIPELVPHLLLHFYAAERDPVPAIGYRIG